MILNLSCGPLGFGEKKCCDIFSLSPCRILYISTPTHPKELKLRQGDGEREKLWADSSSITTANITNTYGHTSYPYSRHTPRTSNTFAWVYTYTDPHSDQTKASNLVGLFPAVNCFIGYYFRLDV
ncbi:hypothetical protein DAPPUDRAFT_254585 [Daphnia pulex]|uniref:Uncharacterized protein n=1 Tax=Daphnia pulex TaxID=6669 RepID=E9H7D7_DAPPU|nr:hypothetical protein DAPPUDRAFT_254585 [Daphnia pulex]|eukprot:EFX72357.1 hypothetical protein DAPPUDRAFT_254585 [Daphnia pulex]